MNNDRYLIILCGGSGERLWPLSRRSRPKQLVPFGGGKTLLEQTIERISPLATSVAQIGLVTTENYQALIEQTVGSTVGTVWSEPVARNTAPALLRVAYEIAQINPDAVIAFLPADHFIPHADQFNQALEQACAVAAAHDVIVTLGVKPTYVATGYGYIQAEPSDQPWAPVQQFHEKPTVEKATEYIAVGNVSWNIGIFVGTAGRFCREAERWAPELYQGIKDFCEGIARYESLPSISFDYAIAEKSDRMVVIPCDFEWNDIGNLAVFLELAALHTDNPSQVVNWQGEGNVAYAGNKVVAYVGVSDLCLIETADVTLVVKKSEAEKVKAMVGYLSQGTLETLL